MRVLITCEFSGHVRDAFAALGQEAWSNDLLPSVQPGHPLPGNVLDDLERDLGRIATELGGLDLTFSSFARGMG